MGLKGLLIACFRVSALVGAQTIPRDTILNILSSDPQLSGLSTVVNSFPLLVQQFNKADNFTFLAPTNDAISLWLATNRSSDYIHATLQYHLLSGTFPSASITSTPIFIPTALTSHSFCNMTGGQRVKATSNDGHLLFGSALQTTSNALSTVGITVSSEALRSIRRLTVAEGHNSLWGNRSHHRQSPGTSNRTCSNNRGRKLKLFHRHGRERRIPQCRGSAFRRCLL